MAKRKDIEKIREELLLASLPHVTFDGWSQAAIRAGAVDLGLESAVALNAFPGGERELIAYFSDREDRRMLAALERCNLAALSISQRVAAGVRQRLEQATPHREALRRGLAFFAMPQNAALGLKCLYRTVDAIWYAAGDRATDYNFYTKRALLAGVYSSTLLFWLNDKSDGAADTWAFLDRRIQEVLKVGGRVGKIVNGLLDLPDRLSRTGAGYGRR